ncbi:MULTISPECIES: sulfotransferase family protein [unclassified Coleofasciculus]|uniref:sulfotransferase family protein n=1 Tax=unclassified Coleofasciculus TaxID=2692782 RepID=UPI001882E422|nr:MULTISPECIES: sulfotransferase [unclassified Coleofasciculus]MBE9125773.1 sulfotransferase [Coleofasciculus sp. LEGE 07081]MBE9148446.1 sulfotransferase [Coleofasciculus sp. LEGE 07092]
MNNAPDFLIIGAMKCATSTLHEQLALQPGIFMTELKEPNFFSNDEEYAKGIEWYLSHFKSASPDDLCGESSTHYTKLPTYPHTIERIQKHLPDVKLIYVMRHPIDRLVSQYIHEWTQGVISVDINQAISKHPELLEYSRYTIQLKPYFETFGQDRVLPVFFERLLKHPQEELEQVCRFIGYKDKPVWDTELDAKNVSSERMRKNTLRDFFVEAPILKDFRRMFIPKSWRTQIRSLWTMKKKPKIEPQQLEHLRTIFDEDLAILGSWLGISLSCDNFKATAQVSSGNWIDLS